MSRMFRSLGPLFRPPFDGLWLLVTLYFGWCFFVYPHSQTLRGNFPDPDDYMYLTQTIDWLKGQGWYDNIQHRLNPPDGTPIHFSRFAQLPMAIAIELFHFAGLGFRGAAMITAWLYPLFLFAGFLWVVRKLAESFVPAKWAGVSAYVALFATGATFMFTPGHVDHHNLVIVLVLGTLALLMRMVEKPDEIRQGIYAGLVLAFGLTVALEILPWLLIMAAWVGLWSAFKGGKQARNGFAFALALYIGSAIFLCYTRPYAALFTPDVLTYSVVYVFLAGGIAAGFAGIEMVRNRPLWIRLLAGGVLAGISGWAFLHRFPDLIAGPYGGMNAELAHMMLGEIDEAKPLMATEDGWRGFAVPLGGTVIALYALARFLRRAKGDDRWRWALMSILLLAGVALTVFYQYRFFAMTSALTIVPLTALLQRGWQKIGRRLDGRKKVFAEIGLLLLAGPLPGILFPAMLDSRSFNTGILLFPVDASVKRNPCDTYVLEKILGDPVLYGNRPRLIVSSIGMGPELLFRTPHTVLSGPFHMDVTGNIDATRFFSTPYASEAESIARRRKIELVVACRYVPDLYTRPPEAGAGTLTGGAGKDFAPHFVELLMTGKAPKWLKEANFRGLNNFVIYEVKLPETEPAATKKSGTPGE